MEREKMLVLQISLDNMIFY